MKSQSKLNSQEQKKSEQHATGQQAAQAAKEFGSVEELLRYDAEQTGVPPGIAKRLEQSLRQDPVPPPPRSWWRRLFAP